MSNNSSQSSISVIPPIKCKNVVKITHTPEVLTDTIPASPTAEEGSGDDDASEDSFDVVEVGLDPLSVAEEDEPVSQAQDKAVLPPESPAVKPPLDRQYQNILLLLSQYNRAISVNTHCNVLYVISSQWISTFFAYHNQTNTTPSCGVFAKMSEIPPIDNSCLLSDESLELFRSEKESKKYDSVSCRFVLRPELAINTDYHLLPIELWEAFVGWYGCIGPPLPRLLFRNAEDGSIKSTVINVANYSKLNIQVECNLSKQDVFQNTIYCLNDLEYERFLYPDQTVCCQEVLDFNHQMSVQRGGRKLGGSSSMSNDNLVGAAGGRSLTGTPDGSCADLQQYQNPSIRRNFSEGGVSPLSSRHNSTARLSPLPHIERSSSSFTPLSTIYSDANTPINTPTPNSNVTVSSNPHQYCFVCHRVGVNQRCSKCSCIIYCGKDCQLAHWPFHKQTCKNLKGIPKKQHIVNYNYLPAYAIVEDDDEKAALNVVFNDNKNNVYLLPLDSWKTTTMTKSQIAQYHGAQKLTYSLYGRSGKVGLANLGNSCYMNSSIQCLSHIMPLTHYMLSQHYVPEINYENRDGTKGELIDAYYRLLSELWFETKASVVPKSFKQILGKINPEYAGLAQQDAHEVIELLLDKLHEDLNRIVGPKPYTTKVDGDGTDDVEKSAETLRLHKLRDDSIVHDTVGSLMRSQLTCPDCGKVSVSFEFHNTVQLAIPRTNNRTFKVVFVPEHKLLKNNTELAKPMSFTITLDRILTVKALKDATLKLIPSEFRGPKTMLCLFESNVPNTSHLTRNLKDHYLLTTLTEGSIVYAYLPSTEFDKHILVYQRIITPKLTNGFTRGGSILDTANFSMQYVGPPIMVSVQKTWHTARAKHLIWKNTLCLFKNGNENIGATMVAEFERAKELSIRVIDNFGHGLVIKNRSLPEDIEAATLAQSNYLTSILSTNISGVEPSASGEAGIPPPPSASPPKSPRKFVVHNSKVVLTQVQKDVWSKAVLKKGPGTNMLEHETGLELPFDKALTLGQLLGSEEEIVFVAMDLIGSQFTKYDLEFYGGLVKSPVDPAKKNNIHGTDASFTLYDCLQEHTKEEILDEGNEWYCNVCKEHKKAKKIVSFARNYLPSVLILTLKRFEFRNIGGYGGGMMNTHREKINNFIDFPIDELDLGAYCGADTPVASTTVGGTVYDLFAVCNHYGRMGFGHYTAVAREWNSISEHHDKSKTQKVYSGNSLSDVWYSYDDNTVSECTDVGDIQNQSAYILFYRRRAA